VKGVLLHSDSDLKPTSILMWVSLFPSIMILPFCVYVLQSERDLLLYHGFTTNLERRLIDHNKGNTVSTSKRRPLKLVYCEFFLSKKDALRRERYFKTTTGKRMLKLLLKETFKTIDYPM
jgi:putative endonuclease